MASEFKPGDRVRCHEPGSWMNDKVGTVIKTDFTGSDGVHGCYLQMEDCVTVVPAYCLEKIVD